MSPTEEHDMGFEEIFDELIEFSRKWMRGEVTDIDGPTRNFEPMPGMFVTEINPVQWPNIVISIIENEDRIVGTRISHAEYTLPIIEVPPPTAMVAKDA